MRRIASVFQIVVLAFAFQAVGHAQTPFSLDAYKSFLAAHGNATGADMLREYPAPLFAKTTADSPRLARYRDSVDFKLGITGDEAMLLDRHGFVVTERLSYPAIGNAFVDVWEKDLAVFVSTDAILHALHASYDLMLKDLEKGSLSRSLDTLLTKLAEAGLPALEMRYGRNASMRPMLNDVDVYITVARRLLDFAHRAQPRYPENEATVNDLMLLITAEQPAEYPLFSATPRILDFSQFTVRGHYNDPGDVSKLLARYFQCMMWLGRTELMLSKPVQQGVPEQTDADIQRQIIDSYLLIEALEASGAEEPMQRMDALLSLLVGESDNVATAHLRELRAELGFSTAEALLDRPLYDRFAAALEQKPYAEQKINAQILMSDPSDPEQLKPPSAFLLLGQRFLPDSYILGSVVFDKIMHDGAKVMRMLPTALDALAGLGNDASAQLLQDELARWHYAPNLMAVRYLIDSFDDAYWQSSVYTSWVTAIRALNPTERLDDLPPFMRTAAWWQEKMNTQLASWAQLRHDNLLYGKQSYTGGAGCSYPEGYVEPYPAFYRTIARFMRSTSDRMSALGYGGFDEYFENFALTMDTLGTIAGKELAATPLSPAEKNFLQTLLFKVPNCTPTYGGWYPRLFYPYYDLDRFMARDYIVADVHTAPTDAAGNPVGWVVHAGTGDINLAVVSAPSAEGGSAIFCGPVLSYHEYTTTNFQRLNDEQWAGMFEKEGMPRPEWTRLYLADKSGKASSPAPSLITGMDETPGSALPPAGPQIRSVYPNPATGTQGAVIAYTIPAGQSGRIQVAVYDITGRLVRMLADAAVPAGSYFTRWDGNTAQGIPAASGAYEIRLSNGKSVAVKTVVLAR